MLRNLNKKFTLTHNNGSKIECDVYYFERGESDFYFKKADGRWITPYEFRKRYRDNTQLPLSLLFTAVYSEPLSTLVSQCNMFLKVIKKDSGDAWHKPVVLGLEHGVIFK